MEEIWKDIQGYEGLYRISSLGRINKVSHKLVRKRDGLTHTRNLIIKPSFLPSGYECYNLSIGGTYKGFYIHRLVAIHFIANPENKPQVNHIDGVKSNNCVSNLEWVTASENQKHKYSTLGHVGYWKGKFSKEHHASKNVYQYDRSGVKFIKKYDAISDARKDGFSVEHISSVCTGKRKHHRGFIWSHTPLHEI